MTEFHKTEVLTAPVYASCETAVDPAYTGAGYLTLVGDHWMFSTEIGDIDGVLVSVGDRAMVNDDETLVGYDIQVVKS